MYKKNFITDVIIRLDFNLPFDTSSKDTLDQFKTNLKIENVELIESPVNKFEFNISDHSKNKFTVEGLQGIYKINDSKRMFILNPNFLHYSSKYSNSDMYNNYQVLEDEFSKGLNSINDINNDVLFKRFSFRFINNINTPEVKKLLDWKNYINNEYISNYGDIKPEEYKHFSLRRKMNSTYLSNGEYMIRINLGIWNESFPGFITNNDFIIDIDCYIQNLILEYSDIKDRLSEMCKIIYKFFNNIIDEKLKNLMVKIEDEK